MMFNGSNAPKGIWAPISPEISRETAVEAREPTWAGAKAAAEATREAMMTDFMLEMKMTKVVIENCEGDDEWQISKAA
jgi:hypothetical protein